LLNAKLIYLPSPYTNWVIAMPIVTIDIWAGRSKEDKKKLIVAVTKAVAESIGCPAQHVNVVINEQPRENWGVGGVQASEMKIN
jgi:4-oxalocrotonate tautomerase